MTETVLATLDNETREAATQMAEKLVTQGYQPFGRVVETIVECAEPEAPVSAAQAATILAPLWTKRLREQETWPEVTDCDRIDTAFQSLAARGIVAAANFTCCMSCGSAEIWEHAAPTDRGYVFFHQQDTERAAESGELLLAYGATSGTDADGVAIGHEIVAALRAAGLTATWDGDIRERIAVSLDWRKRL